MDGVLFLPKLIAMLKGVVKNDKEIYYTELNLRTNMVFSNIFRKKKENVQKNMDNLFSVVYYVYYVY